MRFNHLFELESMTPSKRVYRSDNHTVQLDFFKHMVRVAILRDGEYLIPTYTVCPGDSVMKREGRDKLSTEGFETVSPIVKEDKDSICIELEDAFLSIEKKNFRMKFENKKGLLFQDREYISYNFDHELGRGSMHFITREEEEKIYGLGDKSGNVNKNKRSFKLAASDAMGFDARTSDPLYKQLPFYICENSNGAYGLYYDTYSNGEVNLGEEKNQYYDVFKSFKCNEENLVFYVIFGSVPEILNRFSKMCGRVFFPPKWTLKYCGSTMAYTEAPDADLQLRGFIESCEKCGVQPGGFYLSSGYTSIGDKRCVFNWNTDKVPSPEGLSKYFKDHGVEFLPNVKPAFLTDHPFYEMLAKNNWFLHYSDGTPAQFPFWGGFGSYLDFTNPDAYDFWKKCVKEQLVDKGYKNIWNDNNEYDVCSEEVYAHGFGHPVKACDIRPLFSLLMTMASLEAQDKDKRTYTVSRCGAGGHQRISATWTGDNYTSFDDFRYNYKMGMTMSLSGIYNWGQDIGGFAGPKPSKELFIRWIQYGIFTPRFTLHSWKPDAEPTMPWLYPDLIPQVKSLFDLRERLIPYLYNEMYRTHLTNEPTVYPLFLKYPEADVESDCFFFGDSIISCPVFDRGVSEVHVDLPDNNGGWYLGEECFEGKCSFAAPIGGMPVWLAKGGSVIPFDEEKGLTFNVYSKDEGEFTYEYLVDDGESPLKNKPDIVKIMFGAKKDAVKVEAFVNGEKKEIDKDTCSFDCFGEKAYIKVVDRMRRPVAI